MHKFSKLYLKYSKAIILSTVGGFLSILPIDLYSQNSYEENQLPEIISDSDEILNSNLIPAGTLILNQLGFIECKGTLFLGEPPKGKDIRIIYNDMTYTNSGLWNNNILKDIIDLEYDEKEKIIEAQYKFQAGLKSDPLFFPFIYNSSILFILENKPDKALYLLKKSESLMPGFSGINIAMSRAYELKKEYYAANIELKKAAKKSPLSNEPILLLGFMNLSANIITRSNYYFDYLLNMNKDNIEAKIGKIGVLLHKNKYADAKRELSKIKTDNSFNLTKNKYSFLYHEYMIQIYEKEKQYKKAAEEVKILLDLSNPGYFLTHSRSDLQKQLNKLSKLSTMVSKEN